MPKPREIPLKRPLRVIQVFRNARLFQKGDLAPGQNRDFLRWPEKLSSTGFVGDEALHLSDRFEELDDLNSFNLVFLLDDFSEDSHKSKAWIEDPVLFTQSAAQTRLQFLRVRKLEEATEILLNGADVSWRPKRESRKLCNLKPGKPIEIKINGKSDGHHQRYYIEEQLIFEDLGTCERIIASTSVDPILKKIPQERKLVDLRVLLW